MFKLVVGKKYVCRNGEVRELLPAYNKDCGEIESWWFSLEETHDIHYVFGYEESEWDIVSEYVKKKPRKASSPYKKLLTAKNGDVFILNGEKFEVGVIEDFPMLGQEGIYLTSQDRKNNHDYEYIHVRNKRHVAGMKRQELVDLLKSGKYTIE